MNRTSQFLFLSGIGFSMFVSSAAMAHTLKGSIAFKDAKDNIVIRTGKIDYDEQSAKQFRLALGDNEEQLADKVKVWRFETENRTLVMASFRNVRDMPENRTVIIKGTLLDGHNGKLLYGDVFSRVCQPGQPATDTDEDNALDRLASGVRDRKGCEINYRGAVMLTNVPSDQSPTP